MTKCRCEHGNDWLKCGGQGITSRTLQMRGKLSESPESWNVGIQSTKMWLVFEECDSNPVVKVIQNEGYKL